MLKASIQGLDVVVSGLDQVGVDVREAAFYAVIEVMQKAFEACYHLLSESDHTLKQLALMGHPYATHDPPTGPRVPGAFRGMQIHDPDVIVHTHDSGDYRKGLKAIKPRAAFGDIIDGKIINESELDEIIQNGTPNMRARPWMQWVVDNYGDDFADLLEARIQQAIGRLKLAS